MARARNIKPSFFINEELVELDFSTRLLFIGLWTIADREGRLEDKPKKIKMALFPADDLDVNKALSELQKSGFIVRYTANDIQYIQILAFKKHQNPHKDEKASSIPEYSEHHASTVQAPCKTEIDTVAIGLIPDSLLPITDSLLPIKQARTSALDDGFNEFWNHYPKKVGKDKALIAWKKKKPQIDSVLNALRWQIPSKQWEKENGSFIPNPTTYINDGRWKDEPAEERTPF